MGFGDGIQTCIVFWMTLCGFLRCFGVVVDVVQCVVVVTLVFGFCDQSVAAAWLPLHLA